MTTAPADPPAARPDPMPAAALGMWLFLAGEAMFFAGLLSAFIVLQSSPDQRALFARSAAVVGRAGPAAAVVLIVASAALVWRRGPRWAVAGTAVALLAVQLVVARGLVRHQTIVTATDVYDGRATQADGRTTVEGTRSPLTAGFDVHRTMPADLRSAVAGTFTVADADVRLASTYGPSRNNYFAFVALATGAHAVHVIGGLGAMAWLTARRRTPVAEWALRLYWQFVNGVGLIVVVMLAVG